MDTQKHTPVLLTEAAVTALQTLMEQEGFDTTQHLRIGVKGGGGCAGGGMSYMLGFDQPLEDDARFTVHGIPVIIKRRTHCTSWAWKWVTRTMNPAGALLFPILLRVASNSIAIQLPLRRSVHLHQLLSTYQNKKGPA
ncbi:hypothetical protein MKQ70_02040 [Chitinophaga sedimenti]|uniref:hypothetical protein n=1 Tax=Chitinophaga sedimenti TaxID=2033606 RepID=UPI002003CA33|nr:hypothetical protein [Chitinophaga sedimenti]MCK7553850.1 hypothetical protein [Chitinophaga sedimenti]